MPELIAKTERIGGIMKRLAVLAMLVLVLGPQAAAQRGREGRESSSDEINKTYELGVGARVTVKGINGPVKLETWNEQRAEIRIIKSSEYGPEELQRLEVRIDHTADSLTISTEKDSDNNNVRVRVSVEAKLPRKIALRVAGVNGRCEIGPIEGAADIDGINGRFSLGGASEVKIDGINGATDLGAVDGLVDIDGINGSIQIKQARELKIDGVNGSIQAAFAILGDKGVDIEGVNGTIRLALPDGASARIDITNIQQGDVVSKLPLSAISQPDRREFHAQLGAGATPIRIDGINGSIHLEKSSR
jgi:hypothetical protein